LASLKGYENGKGREGAGCRGMEEEGREGAGGAGEAGGAGGAGKGSPSRRHAHGK